METFTREHMAQAEGAFSSEVVVDELDDEIFVRVLVCCYEPNDEDEFIREYIDCPVRVWLDAPVATRR